MKPVNILFVCMGNICRSPTAQGVFEALVKAEGLDHLINVDSAGVGDWHIGEAPDKRSVSTALGRGYDLSKQRARQVCAEDFSRFEYILAMDLANLSILEQLVPSDFAGTLTLFLEYCNLSGSKEVPDPYAGGSDEFEEVLGLIESGTKNLLNYIRAN
jgi:protein-tyrosine phosphatase